MSERVTGQNLQILFLTSKAALLAQEDRTAVIRALVETTGAVKMSAERAAGEIETRVLPVRDKAEQCTREAEMTGETSDNFHHQAKETLRRTRMEAFSETKTVLLIISPCLEKGKSKEAIIAALQALQKCLSEDLTTP